MEKLLLDELSQERKREYKEAFEMYDIKKDGSILLSDYENVLKFLNLDPTKFELDIHEHEINGDNYVKFEEFMTEINAKKNETEILSKGKDDDIKEVLNIFKSFENGNDGEISITQFREILSSEGGGNLKEEEIDNLISILDKGGYINYKEFIDTLFVK